MPRSARDVPPPLELSCLTALWQLSEGKVKDVQRIVGQSRPLAYTTIMTVLDRLVRKGKITRRKVGPGVRLCSAGVARCAAPGGDSRAAGRFFRRFGRAVDAVSADAGSAGGGVAGCSRRRGDAHRHGAAVGRLKPSRTRQQAVFEYVATLRFCIDCGADPLVRAGPPGPAFRNRIEIRTNVRKAGEGIGCGPGVRPRQRK